MVVTLKQVEMAYDLTRRKFTRGEIMAQVGLDIKQDYAVWIAIEKNLTAGQTFALLPKIKPEMKDIEIESIIEAAR